MVATEANGLSSGLAVIWDPVWVNASAFKCFAGILFSASIRGHNFSFNILNIYVPYKNRRPFWDRLFASEIFRLGFLIIAGDLNFTLSASECWGRCRKMDPLADSLKMEFLNRDLIDISPSKLVPTWGNGRSGDAYIAKRIDRFLVHTSLIDKMGLPFSFIRSTFISDHRPIVLCWRDSGI